MQRNTRGNALFLILIAVALFAALAYAVTRSGRGGGGIGREENELAFAEIQDLISQHRMVIQRMVVGQGLGINQLDFRWSDWDDVNTDCGPVGQATPTDCQVYHANGGGLGRNPIRRTNRASFGADIVYPYFLSRDAVSYAWVANWNQQGTTASDLVVRMPTNYAFCIFYNRKLGVTTDPDSVAVSTIGFFVPVAGWTANSHATGFAAPVQATHLTGQVEGCARHTDDGVYWIFALIWPR
jgi:hypothetical protein